MTTQRSGEACLAPTKKNAAESMRAPYRPRSYKTQLVERVDVMLG